MVQAERAAQDSSPWIESAPWDLGWIHCGFGLAALHAWLLRSPSGFAAWYAFAFLAFWMTHRAGTVFITFGLPEYRALIAAQRTRFVDLPAAWFAFAFGVLFAPTAWLPFGPGDRLRGLVLIRFGYDALHFGGQHYGVVSLYRLRGGQDPRSRFKTVEKAFCLSAAIVSMILPALFRYALPALDPGYSGASGALWASAAFGAFAAFMAAAELAGRRASAPKLLYILYLAGIAFAALNARSILQMGLIVALQHYIVATGLTARMISNAQSPRGGSFLARVRRAPAAPFLILFALGLLPALWGYRSGQTVQLDWLLKRWWSNEDRGFFFKLAAALAYGLSFAHNVWDAAVFRLKDPSVRAVSLPLILGRRPARAAAAGRSLAIEKTSRV
jgi:hypothetical protein